MEDQKRKSEENHQEQLQHPHQYSLLCPGIFYGVLHNCPVSEVKVILDPNVIAKQKEPKYIINVPQTNKIKLYRVMQICHIGRH